MIFVGGLVGLASVWVCDRVLAMSGAAMEACRVIGFCDEFDRRLMLDAPARMLIGQDGLHARGQA